MIILVSYKGRGRWAEIVLISSQMLLLTMQCNTYIGCTLTSTAIVFNPFTPGNFAKKLVLKLVELFSGHCLAIKS